MFPLSWILLFFFSLNLIQTIVPRILMHDFAAGPLHKFSYVQPQHEIRTIPWGRTILTTLG